MSPDKTKILHEMVANLSPEREKEQYYGMFADKLIYKDSYYGKNNIPTVIFELEITADMMNTMGNTHGGALITILDVYSSYAVFAFAMFNPDYKKKIMPTISRTLKGRFIKGTQPGEIVTIECRVITHTRRSEYIEATFFNSSGEPVFEGVHDKVALYKPVV